MENKSGKRTLEFDIGDIPLILEALSLQSATALMYGKVGSQSKIRLQELHKQLSLESPFLQNTREDAYKWKNACNAAINSNWYSVRIPEIKSYNNIKKFRICVVVDGAEYEVCTDIDYAQAVKIKENIINALAEITPIHSILRNTYITMIALSGYHREMSDISKEIQNRLNNNSDRNLSMNVISTRCTYIKNDNGLYLYNVEIEADPSCVELLKGLENS